MGLQVVGAGGVSASQFNSLTARVTAVEADNLGLVEHSVNTDGTSLSVDLAASKTYKIAFDTAGTLAISVGSTEAPADEISVNFIDITATADGVITIGGQSYLVTNGVDYSIQVEAIAAVMTRTVSLQVDPVAQAFADTVGRVTQATQQVELVGATLYRRSTTVTGTSGTHDYASADQHDGIRAFVYENADAAGTYALFEILGEVAIDFFFQDGDTDAEGIQRALDALVASVDTAAQSYTISLYGSPKSYFVDTSLDACSIRGAGGADYSPWYFDGRGMTIVGSCTGKAILDLLNSRACYLSNINFEGSSVNRPRCAIQIGRNSGGSSADSHTFNNIICEGEYSLTALLNCASENLTATACRFENDYNDANAFAMIQSGSNGYEAVSDYETVKSGTVNWSFNENKFSGCQWLKRTAGSACWISNTKMHTYHGYAFSYTDTAWIVDRFGEGVADGGHRNLEILVHNETQIIGTGLLNNIKFQGGGTTLTIEGFKHVDHGLQCENAVFETGGSVTTVVLHGVDVQIGGIASVEPGTGTLFGTASQFTVTGNMTLLDDADQLNLVGVASFSGNLYIKNFANKTHYKGPYILHDYNSLRFMGAVSHMGNAASPQKALESFINDSNTSVGFRGYDFTNSRYFITVATSSEWLFGATYMQFPGGVRITRGTGSPEGVLSGSVSDMFLRTDGGAGTTLYVKESGSATNTGWVAK